MIYHTVQNPVTKAETPLEKGKRVHCRIPLTCREAWEKLEPEIALAILSRWSNGLTWCKAASSAHKVFNAVHCPKSCSETRWTTNEFNKYMHKVFSCIKTYPVLRCIASELAVGIYCELVLSK